MTTLELHLGYLSELNSVPKSEHSERGPLAYPLEARDSIDMQEDTSIPAYAGVPGEVKFPLQLVASTDLSNLYVRYGTVDGIVPTISATPLSADYTQNALSFSASGTTSFYLTCVVSVTNGVSSTDSVSIGTSSSSETSTNTVRLIGSVIATGGDLDTVSNVIQGSQNVDSCGAIHSWNLV